MKNSVSQKTASNISTLGELAQYADYSLMDTLNADPDATADGADHGPLS